MSHRIFVNYQLALVRVTCDKMRRAWRNRSNVTHWQWIALARKILGEETSQQEAWRFAACLYVACGWYAARCGSDTFDGSIVPPRGWDLIRAMTEDFLVNPPDRALTRGAWETLRQKEALARKQARKLERES